MQVAGLREACLDWIKLTIAQPPAVEEQNVAAIGALDAAIQNADHADDEQAQQSPVQEQEGEPLNLLELLATGALDEVEEIMERSSFDGMVTTNQSLQALVEAGRVDADKAVAVSLKPNELAQALRGRS